jgi:hypothetical protein
MLTIFSLMGHLTPVMVRTGPTHTLYLTQQQANRIDILLLGDQRIFHVVFAATKTVSLL